MRIILTGGFLGAGKTTLLHAAANQLMAEGVAVGLVTNDQAPELVDTALLAQSGAQVREVAGSCFCCNFNGFVSAARSLESAGCTVVLAEPVGSCTDLSATIAQPLKALHPRWNLAPLSVLVDPLRVRQLLAGEYSLLHPDAAYIFRVQLQEADRIVLTKGDTLTAQEREFLVALLTREFPQAVVDTLSAKTGEGVGAWLAEMRTETNGGQTIATVDYDRYANGEAVLGWLNATVDLRWIGGLQADWSGFAQDLLAGISQRSRDQAHEIAHLKLRLAFPQGSIAGSVTGADRPPALVNQGDISRLSARLTVNARVQISPQGMEKLFLEGLKSAAHGRVGHTVTALHCLSPGRPVPTHRFAAVTA